MMTYQWTIVVMVLGLKMLSAWKIGRPVLKFSRLPMVYQPQSIPDAATAPWDAIKHLQENYKSHPWPQPGGEPRKLPLEQVVPSLLLLALTSFQGDNVGVASPATFVKRLEVESMPPVYAIVTVAPGTRPFRPWVSFREFDHCTSSNKDDVMAAYLMLSFSTRAPLLVCLFATLLRKSLDTHIFTYQGERIVGWSIQEGTLRLRSNTVPYAISLGVPSEADAQRVADTIMHGSFPPEWLNVRPVDAFAVHMWLTFVTEGGGMFDLDLSSLQFGETDLPFPCILPLHNVDTPTALHGLCDRKRVLSVNFDGCMQTATTILDSEITTLNDALKDLVILGLDVLVHKWLSDAGTELPQFAADPSCFWNRVRDM